MKKWLMSLGFVLFTTSAMACADFTGNYKSQETGATYSVAQSACATVTITEAQKTETITTDGQFRVVSEDEFTIIKMAASFVGETSLLLDTRVEYKVAFPPEVPTDKIPVKITVENSLDSAGNLVSVGTVYNAAGGVIETKTTTDQRI